jgi:hypothetical protein
MSDMSNRGYFAGFSTIKLPIAQSLCQKNRFLPISSPLYNKKVAKWLWPHDVCWKMESTRLSEVLLTQWYSSSTTAASLKYLSPAGCGFRSIQVKYSMIHSKLNLNPKSQSRTHMNETQCL